MTVWYHACWMFTTQKDGVSAVSLQRVLEIGSYQTAWAMLHRLRSVLVRPGRDGLAGTVEMDETYVGGDEPGLRGGRAKGKKVLVGIAVERRRPTGFGRTRMAVLPDTKIQTLRGFLHDHIEPGSTVATDGLQVYRGIMSGYTHDWTVASDTSLPGTHRVASLLKRWLLSTHQGSVDEAHLPGYLNEFAFRFNRRTSRSRGLLFLRARTRRGTRPGPLQGPPPQSRATAAKHPAGAARAARTSDKRPAPGCRPTLATTGRPALLRLNGDP